MCRRFGLLSVVVVIALLVTGCQSIDESLTESLTISSMKADIRKNSSDIGTLGGSDLEAIRETIKRETGDLDGQIKEVKRVADGNSARLADSAANAQSAKETADQMRGEWTQVRTEVKAEWQAQKAEVDKWWKDTKAETEDQMNRWLQSFGEKSKTIESTLDAKCKDVDDRLGENTKMVDDKVKVVDGALEKYSKKEDALEAELKDLTARHKALCDFLKKKFSDLP